MFFLYKKTQYFVLARSRLDEIVLILYEINFKGKLHDTAWDARKSHRTEFYLRTLESG